MWNNRVIHHHDPKGPKHFCDWYEIHEVFYDDNDNVEFWTEDGVGPFGNTLEELRSSYDMMAEAFELPVLEEDELEKTHGVLHHMDTVQFAEHH